MVGVFFGLCSDLENVHIIFVAIINGGWGPWSSYTICSKLCGTGSKSRTRLCNNPVPSKGGSGCSGVSTDTVYCHTEACPCSGSHCPGNYKIQIVCQAQTIIPQHTH